MGRGEDGTDDVGLDVADRRATGTVDRAPPPLLGQVLLATLPVHAVAPDVGFALKPWLVVLAVAVVLRRRDLLACLRAQPTSVHVGAALLLGGATAGTLAAPTLLSVRHLVAVAAALALLVVWPAIRPGRRATATALRVGGWLIVVPAVVESMLLLAGSRISLLLEGVDGLVAPLGDVVYGDILVPHGLHTDSNFLALYAVTWMFLLLAHRAPGPTSPVDALLLGGLAGTVLISFSRGGVLALVAATALWIAVRPTRRVARRSTAMAVLGAVLVVGLVLVADVGDGVGDLERSSLKRLDATLAESGSLLGDFGGFDRLGDRGQDEAIAAELEQYTEWSPPRSLLWSAYAQSTLDHPITGIGFGTGSERFRNYAHNVLLEAAAGGGVLALLGTVVIVLGAAWALVRRRPFGRRDAGLAAAAVAFATGSMLLSTNYSPLAAIVLALLLGVDVGRDEQDDRDGRVARPPRG